MSSFISDWRNAPMPFEKTTKNRYTRKLNAATMAVRPYALTMACVSCAVRCGLFVLLTIFPDDVQREHVEGQGHEEQHQAQSERGQRLGAVELLVTDQQRHD